LSFSAPQNSHVPSPTGIPPLFLGFRTVVLSLLGCFFFSPPPSSPSFHFSNVLFQQPLGCFPHGFAFFSNSSPISTDFPGPPLRPLRLTSLGPSLYFFFCPVPLFLPGQHGSCCILFFLFQCFLHGYSGHNSLALYGGFCIPNFGLSQPPPSPFLTFLFLFFL